MQIKEAQQVLNLEKGATKEEITKVRTAPAFLPCHDSALGDFDFLQAFERYYASNAGKDGVGGSPYLQAKLENAKVALIKEFDVEGSDPESEEKKDDEGAGKESSSKL